MVWPKSGKQKKKDIKKVLLDLARERGEKEKGSRQN